MIFHSIHHWQDIRISMKKCQPHHSCLFVHHILDLNSSTRNYHIISQGSNSVLLTLEKPIILYLVLWQLHIFIPSFWNQDPIKPHVYTKMYFVIWEYSFLCNNENVHHKNLDTVIIEWIQEDVCKWISFWTHNTTISKSVTTPLGARHLLSLSWAHKTW